MKAGRKIIASVLGIVLMSAVVATLEAIGHRLYPPPSGFDLSKPEDLARLMAVLPTPALASVLLGWMLGAFAGAALAARLGRPHGLWPALVVGIAMLLASAATMLMIPHPWWMLVFGLLTPLPLAWLAARWLGR